MAGGDIQYNPNYGEYIVWPEALDLNQELNYGDTHTASRIAEHFGLTSQKINLYLAELGWIEKDPRGGWTTTPAGTKNGAIQMEAHTGIPYVVWIKDILDNKHLLREISGVKGIETDSQVYEMEADDNGYDFRRKYPATLRTPDGHLVRSRAEVLIDDFLYKNGIVHAYERKLNIDEPMYCDFYIPKGNIYIEYWGLEDQENYLTRKKEKLRLYAKYSFNLIEINDSDIANLDEILATKLRRYNIRVD